MDGGCTAGRKGERMDKKACEVAIVGGGPAGLTAGLYLCRADVDAVMLDRELTG
ncbi:MAG: FAD-dependent monooxygenase, partial [Actinobacteria bacterium]|nr:FAD-dependent monooxygenase [Actinomycetota bacterium]